MPHLTDEEKNAILDRVNFNPRNLDLSGLPEGWRLAEKWDFRVSYKPEELLAIDPSLHGWHVMSMGEFYAEYNKNRNFSGVSKDQIYPNNQHTLLIKGPSMKPYKQASSTRWQNWDRICFH